MTILSPVLSSIHAEADDALRPTTHNSTLWKSLFGFAAWLAAMAVPGSALPVGRHGGIRNIVLVHGAFSDGSIWQDVVPLLQARGYIVTAVQNPLTSLADDVTATRRVLERQQGGVLLVGHSWAGAVVTEAGMAENVKGIVYLSAMVPDAGESAAEMMQKRNSPMEGLVPDHDGFVWLDDAETYAHVMAGDVAPQRVAILAASQQPINAKAFSEKVKDAAWSRKPTWYLLTEGDNALPPAVQKWLAQHIGATTIAIKSSHLSMVSHPQEVADFIANAAKAIK